MQVKEEEAEAHYQSEQHNRGAVVTIQAKPTIPRPLSRLETNDITIRATYLSRYRPHIRWTRVTVCSSLFRRSNNLESPRARACGRPSITQSRAQRPSLPAPTCTSPLLRWFHASRLRGCTNSSMRYQRIYLITQLCLELPGHYTR